MPALVFAASTDLGISPPMWGWGLLLAFLIGLLLIDLLVLHRKAHVVGAREAAWQSALWVAIALGFAAVVGLAWGRAAAGEYLTGWVLEKSLSVDNVFVWAVLFAHFRVPRAYQHRVLYWGIFGALVLRAAFIFAGVSLLHRFDWLAYVFGFVLLYAAIRMFVGGDHEVDPGSSRLLRFVRRIVPSTPDYDGQRLFTRSPRRLATPLFAVLVIIEISDVIFAVDSVPAVLAVSRDEFIVFASNAFAIIGLRSLFFLLADLHSRFLYLEEGLAVVLGFVGLKMLLARWFDIPTGIALLVIAAVIGVAVGFSLFRGRADATTGRSAAPRR